MSGALTMRASLCPGCACRAQRMSGLCIECESDRLMRRATRSHGDRVVAERDERARQRRYRPERKLFVGSAA